MSSPSSTPGSNPPSPSTSLSTSPSTFWARGSVKPLFFSLLMWACLLPLGVGCSAARDEPGDIDTPTPDLSGAGRSDMGISTMCQGLYCQIPKCPAGTSTEIVGRLFAGNGKDPIPGAAVFVPVHSLPEFPPTLGCDLCNSIPTSVAVTATEPDGSFRLRGVPAGSIPVVARLGRFQRVLQMEAIPCAENTVPSDPDTSGKGIRMPKKSRELSSQDNVPRIAVVSGDYDQLECVLKRIGVEELDMYNGRATGTTNPPAIAEMGTLLTDEKKLLSYNILIVNCTDNQYQSLLASKPVQKNLELFVRSGGRLYVTDWAYDVIEQVPEFSPYLCFQPQSIPGPLMCTGGPERPTGADSREPYGDRYKVLDKDMAAWLRQFPSVIDGSDTVRVDYSFVVVNQASKDPLTPTKTWVEGRVPSYGVRPQTVTFDYKDCGRVHFSTYNTEPNGVVDDSQRWPRSCKADFTPQERLLEFLFFNIAACLSVPG